MKVEKFPSIRCQNKELLWDTRQKIQNPLVAIRKDLDPEVRKNLEKLPHEMIFEGADFDNWGQFLAELLKNPSRKLTVIGVVGTNGKTTTAALLRHLLVANGKKVLELGTLGAQLWEARNNTRALYKEMTGFTSPDSATLQDLLRQCVDEHVDVVVMEVTSHAVALGRVEGVDFDAALFLNFSQDHLDFHKTLEAYKWVKKSFFKDFLRKQVFKKHPCQIINQSDPVGAELFSELQQDSAQNVYSVKKDENYWVKGSLRGLEFKMFGTEWVTLPLYGNFLAENIATAVQLLSLLLKVEVAQLIDQLKDFAGVPGRMQKLQLQFDNEDRNFIIDFAHTPESLRSVLKSLREAIPLNSASRLWVVFGCGGDRDKLKRPLMGKIAEELADVIVLTSDNPRSEDPELIISQIEEGIQQKAFERVTDRRAAFAFALKSMSPQDLCLIAGRGHEEFQIIGSEKKAFLDAQVLNDLSKTLSR